MSSLQPIGFIVATTPILLTKINFNPSMYKQSRAL